MLSETYPASALISRTRESECKRWVHRRCRAFVFQRFFKVAALESKSRPSEGPWKNRFPREKRKEERERERESVRARVRWRKRRRERKGETLLSFYEHLRQPGLSPARYDGITFSVRDHKHVRLRFLSTVVTEFEKWIFCGGATMRARALRLSAYLF